METKIDSVTGDYNLLHSDPTYEAWKHNYEVMNMETLLGELRSYL